MDIAFSNKMKSKFEQSRTRNLRLSKKSSFFKNKLEKKCNFHNKSIKKTEMSLRCNQRIPIYVLKINK